MCWSISEPNSPGKRKKTQLRPALPILCGKNVERQVWEGTEKYLGGNWALKAAWAKCGYLCRGVWGARVQENFKWVSALQLAVRRWGGGQRGMWNIIFLHCSCRAVKKSAEVCNWKCVILVIIIMVELTFIKPYCILNILLSKKC